MERIETLKLNLQDWYDKFMWKYGEERRELAKERLQVHKLNLEGKCPVNPYTEPESNWYEYITEEG